MTNARPFRTSISARILSIAVSFALVAGGLVSVLDVRSAFVLPLVLMVTVLAGIVALVLGIEEHPEAVVLLSIVLPLALLPFSMLLIHLTTEHLVHGWVLVAVGAVPLIATALASIGAPRAAYTRAPRSNAAANA